MKKEPKRRFKKIRSLLGREKKVSLLVDGPNMLRRIDGHQIRLEDIEDATREIGKIQTARVFLDRYAPERLMQAIVNSGFDPVVAMGDVHVHMAMSAMDILFSTDINVVAIASRHARCAPILRRIKERGFECASIGFDPGYSIALQNAADYVFKLETEPYEDE